MEQLPVDCSWLKGGYPERYLTPVKSFLTKEPPDWRMLSVDMQARVSVFESVKKYNWVLVPKEMTSDCLAEISVFNKSARAVADWIFLF